MSQNLSGIDLNLLVSLQVLLEEKHVTHSAKRLCVTPSAMSKTLTRLRELFNDELFYRTKIGLVPTPMAETLMEPLNQLLTGVEQLVHPQSVAPDAFEGIIRIAIPEPVAVVVVPHLVDHLKQAAPHVVLQIHNVPDDYAARVEDGSLDFVVYPQPKLPGLLSTPAGGLKLSCFMRSDHPLAAEGAWNEESFLSTEEIFYPGPDIGGHWMTLHMEEMRAHQHERLLCETSQLLTAVNMLLTTDAILLSAEGMQNWPLCQGKIVERPLPDYANWSDMKMQLYLITHPRTQNSQIHQWLAEQIQLSVSVTMPMNSD